MNLIKISSLIAIGLLLLAIAKLPYGYYMFLRIVITIIAITNALEEVKSLKKIWLIVFIIIAIIYNPIIPIYLKKHIWIPINITVAGIFTVSIFKTGFNKILKK